MSLKIDVFYKKFQELKFLNPALTIWYDYRYNYKNRICLSVRILIDYGHNTIFSLSGFDWFYNIGSLVFMWDWWHFLVYHSQYINLNVERLLL